MGILEILHAFETREAEPNILQAKWYIMAVNHPSSSPSHAIPISQHPNYRLSD